MARVAWASPGEAGLRAVMERRGSFCLGGRGLPGRDENGKRRRLGAGRPGAGSARALPASPPRGPAVLAPRTGLLHGLCQAQVSRVVFPPVATRKKKKRNSKGRHLAGRFPAGEHRAWRAGWSPSRAEGEASSRSLGVQASCHPASSEWSLWDFCRAFSKYVIFYTGSS